MGIETAITGGLGLLNGVMGSDAAENAADTQAEAGDKATALQKEMFDKQIELQEPFRQAGLTGQNRLMELLGLGGNANAQGYGSAMKNFGQEDFQADPGYQFRLEQGRRALDRSAAARGGMLSGAAIKSANDYGQNMASQEYGNAFNRYQTNRANQLNPLQSLAGQAQTSSNQVGNAAQNYGAQAGSLMTQAGNARASGYVGGANAYSNALGQGFSNYQNQQLLNKYRTPNTTGGSSGSSGDLVDELTGYGVF